MMWVNDYETKIRCPGMPIVSPDKTTGKSMRKDETE